MTLKGVCVCLCLWLVFVLRYLLRPILLVLTITAATGPQSCFSYCRHDCFLFQRFSCLGILPDESGQSQGHLDLQSWGLWPGHGETEAVCRQPAVDTDYGADLFTLIFTPAPVLAPVNETLKC